MPIHSRQKLLYVLKISDEQFEAITQHYNIFHSVTREIHWIKRKQRGHIRCAGHTEAGHKCLYQVGMGRRGLQNLDTNSGFCYVCRPETDNLIACQESRLIRIRLRHLKQRVENFRTSQPLQAEAWARAVECEVNYRHNLIITQQHNQKEETQYVTIDIQKQNKDINNTNIETLFKNNKKLAISLYHDEYVAWTKQQPNYKVEICSICIEPCRDNESYTKCGHLFHKRCIDMWNMKNGCPNCRTC